MAPSRAKWEPATLRRTASLNIRATRGQCHLPTAPDRQQAYPYYLRRYMPTDIALDAIRTRRGLKWGVPAMLLAVPYLLAGSICTSLIAEAGRAGSTCSCCCSSGTR